MLNSKHLYGGNRKHEKSEYHLKSFVKYFAPLMCCANNTGHKASIDRHNQVVDKIKNRSIISKLIDSLKFCVIHKPGIRGHVERDDFGDRVFFFWVY